MIEIGIAVLSLLLGANSTPQCNYAKIDNKYTLKCVSDGNEYVLKNGLFSNQERVEQIVLDSCHITEIQCDAFSKLLGLTVLKLSDNKLHELKPCVLNNLHKLTDLSVRNNKISELPSDTFAQVNNLRSLDLARNRLKILQPDVFDRLTKLEYLYLTDNAIDWKYLTPRIFTTNTNILKLEFSNNIMSAAPENLLQSFQTLKILKLYRCSLTKVPSFATKYNLKTLTGLSLGFNQIRSLDDPTAFINLVNLKILYLNRNSIENIVDYVFTPLRKLTKIRMGHNRLKSISGRLFQDLPKLVHINLSYNEIEVINLDSFRNTPLEFLDLSGNRISYMPANFYNTLTIMGGNLKTFKFNNNPWQCACLREIFEEVKTHNLKYDSAAYDGKRPVCNDVTNEDFRTCKRG